VRLWDVSPEGWLAIACNRLQYHPLLNQPETLTSDPGFLQIAQRSRTVCQQRVWHRSTASSQAPTTWFDDVFHRIASIFGDNHRLKKQLRVKVREEHHLFTPSKSGGSNTVPAEEI
jgi:hypothetical protein